MEADMTKILILAAMLTISTFVAQEGPDSDGKYHNPLTGKEQPATCDNSFKNTHPCECSRATSCNPKDRTAHPSVECSTYCRTDACKCVSACGSIRGRK